ncbi:MAG: hypothetical protein HY037_01580, partial [Nitrospirae bacterium]|nr:hypothetical protein [Candidatus Troglogloeales bacterium]
FEVLPVPDLVITSLSTFQDTAGAGKSIGVIVTVLNQGTRASESTSLRLLFSTDTSINLADVSLGNFIVPALGVNESHTITGIATMPESITSGTYTMGGCVDPENTIAESIETNNCLSDGQVKIFSLGLRKYGKGTITSTPSGINCGAFCSEDYIDGSVVILTAVPASDSVFLGWSEGGTSPADCSGTGTCTLLMDRSHSVVATFGFPLTVTKDGSGSGTVTSDSPGIDCGEGGPASADCSETYTGDTTMVILKASPAPDSVFVGWSGGGTSPADCTGTGLCAFFMNTSRSVTARFDLAPTGPLTKEAVTVWQHRDIDPVLFIDADWDIWYSFIGRPNEGDPTSSLSWHAKDGPVRQAAPIATISGDDKNPHVASNAGEVLAVWQHAPGTDFELGDWDIFYSRFDKDTEHWEIPKPIALLSGDDYDPAVAVDTNGNAVAIWVHWNLTGSREILYSLFSSATATWSPPVSIGGPSFRFASLPEIALTSVSASQDSEIKHKAFAAWSDVPVGQFQSRMVYSIFDGLTWTAPAEIESAATGIDISIHDVVFSEYSDDEDSDPFGAFGRVGVTADRDGKVYVLWSGGPSILDEFSDGVVGATLDMATNIWTPMLTLENSRFIGTGENPDGAVTRVTDPMMKQDFVGVSGSFDPFGYINHLFREGEAITSVEPSYHSIDLFDDRPSNAAISATEMISVNWAMLEEGGGEDGEGYLPEEESEIIWSAGTITPGVSAEFGKATHLVPEGLDGEDLFPEIAFVEAKALVPPPSPPDLPDLPDLIVTSISPSKNVMGAGESFDIVSAVHNQGGAPASSTSLRIFLSNDTIIDATDLALGDLTVLGLAADESLILRGTLTIPETVSPGTYTLGGCIDPDGIIAELDEENNCRVGGQITIPIVFPLNVTRVGSGSGAVISNPPGIDCGTDCSKGYLEGSVVTLTAIPDADSVFSGWSGACTGTGNCTVIVNAAKAVTATFTRIYTLSVAKVGSGSGVVTSNPSGIDCGSDCVEGYLDGTIVTLTATPSIDSTFSRWSGDCAGTGVCLITMDAAKSVTAILTRLYSLSVAKAGSGSGAVTSDPSGITCGSDCVQGVRVLAL